MADQVENLCHEEAFTSADKFLDFLNPSKPPWREGEYPTWIFRGQWDGSVAPMPSAWRDTKEDLVAHGFKQWMQEHKADGASEAFEAFAKREETERSTKGISCPFLKKHIEFCIGERWFLPKFAELATKIGFSVGESYSDIKSPGRTIMRFYRKDKKKPKWPKWPFKTTLSPVTTFAQHHGIPTRLLDWTWNPYTAAYFAAASGGTRVANSSEKLGVLAIRPRIVQGRVLLHHATADLHVFARAQEGVFTQYSKLANKTFMTTGKWPNLFEAVNAFVSPEMLPVFCKVTLPQTEAASLLKSLYFLRSHRARLMPTHDNVAKQLLELWSN